MSQPRAKKSTSVSCRLSRRDFNKLESICALNDYSRADLLKVIMGKFLIEQEQEKEDAKEIASAT
jgi:hypothetical protein